MKTDAKRIPVILDTDIGGDIDDTWALAMMLKCPELDVKLVLSDTGDTVYRARLIAKLLEAGGRADIPVGVGIPFDDMKGKYFQKEWVDGYRLTDYRGTVYADGVDAMIDIILQASEPVTLISISPMPNIGAALKREPRIAGKARFVGMHGSVRKGYGNSSDVVAECNVHNHTTACQKVFSAAWDMTITPLDTCGLIELRGEKLRKVRDAGDPLCRAIMENYRIWLKNLKKPEREFEEKSSTLFDTVAIYLAFAQDLLVMEDLGIRVTDDGYTRIDEKAKRMHVATAWKNLEAFEDLLVRRLVEPVR